MDGYDELIKTKTWAAIRKAQEALFDIQSALKEDGLPDFGEEFGARLLINNLENRLRYRFKHEAVSAPAAVDDEGGSAC